ncbi:hypothetical protein MRS44_016554 [Fusarium solani]|uniref:Uncharacterized protein n=1 Tax=Fusarium solani TaxID=169388 RepID=A0A9P9HE43_FUSSL|nr:uncharacterized protein B0J15DRAFT_34990 [Fusarium solani]KAH7254784.1 hypothetical protein B0J15DRAFT_34990 [Fusarium solani]KAJ3456531.1 hypothetical protein MRS44_016554 [Fusarium solani]
MSTTTAVPEFFELSWSILFTVCMGNVFFGFLVCGITRFTPLALVPIITSAAGAIANGLCYYANYGNHPPIPTAVTSTLGDILWPIQEVGLLGYSYMILQQLLTGSRRRVFQGLFWSFIGVIVVVRVVIIVFRVQYILHGNASHLVTVNYVHIGYFGSIAILECISAYFLITTLVAAERASLQAALRVGLFRYLARSTEIRVALLAVQGVFRTVTHAIKTPGQQVSNIGSQLDRFAYALLCLFPVVLYIDLLASKLKSGNGGSSSYTGANGKTQSRNRQEASARVITIDRKGGEEAVYESRITTRRHSSQECIMETESFGTGPSDVPLEELDVTAHTNDRRHSRGGP